MKQLILFNIFTTVFKVAVSQISEDVGTECPSPVKCLTDTEFTFCSIMNGQIVLQDETITCPTGYLCVEDPYIPCVDIISTTTLRPTTIVHVTSSTQMAHITTLSTKTSLTTMNETMRPTTQYTDSKPDICVPGTIFPAEKCFQYYECKQFSWWLKLYLRTCYLGFAFDSVKLMCVPIYETNCSV